MLTDRTWVQRQCILQQLNISNFRQFIKECEQSIMCLWWMDGWMVDGCSWLVWCLTVMIKTVNTKTNSECDGAPWHIDCLLHYFRAEEVELYHAMDNVGPAVAAALPSLMPRLAHHPLPHLHLPTTLPGHFSLEARQSMLYQIKKDPSLFFLISVKVSYRELQIIFYY